ncbi:helix-turn-helix transcriptional regulator [Meridianimarinicoccus sp. RP-17]|uniref:helix-turn-helix transcriptional regulator n=1 Tax=Meridianimarinicoccus zhengii TaxID=2056810 RepID=UPI000DABDC97|nr:hypothetical protein [Phycocomes zhengii]
MDDLTEIDTSTDAVIVLAAALPHNPSLETKWLAGNTLAELARERDRLRELLVAAESHAAELNEAIFRIQSSFSAAAASAAATTDLIYSARNGDTATRNVTDGETVMGLAAALRQTMALAKSPLGADLREALDEYLEDRNSVKTTGFEERRARLKAVPSPKDPHIKAARVREICGGISDMTLWRWLENAEMGFPRPVYIGRRRYWREADVVAWLELQREST